MPKGTGLRPIELRPCGRSRFFGLPPVTRQGRDLFGPGREGHWPERWGGTAAGSAAGGPKHSGKASDLSGQSAIKASGNGESDGAVAHGDVDLLAAHLGEIRPPGDEREARAVLDDGDASGRKRDIARMPASDLHALGHRPVDLVEFSL